MRDIVLERGAPVIVTRDTNTREQDALARMRLRLGLRSNVLKYTRAIVLPFSELRAEQAQTEAARVAEPDWTFHRSREA